MSAEPIKTASMKWLVGILVMVLISVVGYSYSGTCDKVNEHERRIQAVERTSVKMDFNGWILKIVQIPLFPMHVLQKIGKTI